MLHTPHSSPTRSSSVSPYKSSPRRTSASVVGRILFETTNAASSFQDDDETDYEYSSVGMPTPQPSQTIVETDDDEDNAEELARSTKRRRVMGDSKSTSMERDVFHANDDEIRDTASVFDASQLSTSYSGDDLFPARTTPQLQNVAKRTGISSRRAMLMARPGFTRGNPMRYALDEPNPLLTSLVTRSQTDLYRFHTPDYGEDSLMNAVENGTYCVPFVSVYSHEAKLGRGHLAAVATQEGTVEVVDLKPRELFDAEPTRNTIIAHENAVFDVTWSLDDSRIATSSGDHSSAIFDVTTNQRIAILRSHKLSVKTTLWHPSHPDLLASCSRDGDIHGWDLRERSATAKLEFKPIWTIPQAHGDTPGSKSTRGSKVLRSVTSINFLPHRENLLLSSGSADGILRIWDVRYTTPTGRKRKTGTTAVIKDVFDQSRDLTALRLSSTSPTSTFLPSSSTPPSTDEIVVSLGRSRAICDVAVHPSGSVAWGLGKDGQVYTYHIDSAGWFTAGSSPFLPPPPSTAKPSLLSRSKSYSQTTTSQLAGTTETTSNSNLTPYLTPPLTRPHALKVDTFYPRIAMSPDGRWVACGSSSGNVVLWDVDAVLKPCSNKNGLDESNGRHKTARDPVVLGGGGSATAETSGVDWGHDSLLSCSDDYGVRVWRRDPAQARECREEEKRDPFGAPQSGAWGYALL
ncbi:WD40 repeat-like protein [Clavulina sp. PMI_390]|nr:WD40 repeat-like protein [Clavulina sp. PMI_390]